MIPNKRAARVPLLRLYYYCITLVYTANPPIGSHAQPAEVKCGTVGSAVSFRQVCVTRSDKVR